MDEPLKQPLSQRFLSLLPRDESVRLQTGDLPQGARALLATAGARQSGAALAVLPTPHHLDVFLGDLQTLAERDRECVRNLATNGAVTLYASWDSNEFTYRIYHDEAIVVGFASEEYPTTS